MNALADTISGIFGNDVTIAARRSVGGGCINDTAVLQLSNGEQLFLKQNTLTHPQLFEAEAIGLKHLICDGGPRVPLPIACFRDESHQYLILEYLSSGKRRPDYWEQFGHQLAHLHQSVRNSRCGFEIDNFIGATPQLNEYRSNWLVFFRDMRLTPQIRMASRYLTGALRRQLDALLDRLDQFIVPPDGDAVILHGDLWTGNAMTGPNGEPVIIDPATYYGHREADIAMTQLFGRFGGCFYDAYNESWPLQPGWETRMDLYNLYHMINHVNLFGSGYLGSVASIVNSYV
ncbi:MAG: fructosamine kinase family protein [Deltaproteobacteria bacterium]|nr:fructosamine kinase family protein [Deltaproteobacteria bacterium]